MPIIVDEITDHRRMTHIVRRVIHDRVPQRVAALELGLSQPHISRLLSRAKHEVISGLATCYEDACHHRLRDLENIIDTAFRAFAQSRRADQTETVSKLRYTADGELRGGTVKKTTRPQRPDTRALLVALSAIREAAKIEGLFDGDLRRQFTEDALRLPTEKPQHAAFPSPQSASDTPIGEQAAQAPQPALCAVCGRQTM